MADDGKIRASDLVDPQAHLAYEKLSTSAKKSIEAIKSELKGLVIEYSALVKVLNTASAQEAEATKRRQELAEITLKSKKAQQEIRTELVAYNAELDKATKAKVNASREEAAANKAKFTAIKLQQQQQRGLKIATSNYRKLANALNKARNKAKDLAVTNGIASKEFQKQQRIVTRLDNRIKKIDASLGQYQRNVGNYSSAVKGMATSFRQLASAFGFAGGIFLFANFLRSSFSRVKDFDQAINDLAGTMNVTRESIKNVEADAIRLGATTKYTATQVAILQKQLAKKGFSNEEIINSTEAIVDLAVATGEDLAKTAEVTSATLRAMGLDTSETARVVNVMASSFTKTALDLESFTESAKFVTPIARKANISLEQLTGLLGVLADNGIKGSIAGTGLRKIISELDKSGKPLIERLRELSEQWLSLGDATDEVGQRAQTSLLVLTSEIEVAERLGTAFANVGDVAKEMADKQMASLENRLILLDSAWDGIIQRANVSNGAVSKFNKAITFLTNNLETIINVIYELVTTWAVFKGAVFLTTVVMRNFRIATELAKVAMLQFTGSAKKAKLAMEGLNVATKANPFALIAGLIAIAALEAYNFAQAIKESANQLIELEKAAQRISQNLAASITSQKNQIQAGLEEINVEGQLEGADQNTIKKRQLEYIKGWKETFEMTRDIEIATIEAGEDYLGQAEALRAQIEAIEVNRFINPDDKIDAIAKLQTQLDTLAPKIAQQNRGLEESVAILQYLRKQEANLQSGVRPDETPQVDNKALDAAEKAARLRIDILIKQRQREAEATKESIDDLDKSEAERLSILEDYKRQQNAISELFLEKDKIGRKKTNEEIELAEENHIDRLSDIQYEGLDIREEIAKGNLEKVQLRLKEIEDAEIDSMNKRIAEAITGLRRLGVAEEDIQAAIEQIRNESYQNQINAQIAFIDEMIANLDPLASGYEEILRILNQLKAAYVDLGNSGAGDNWASKAEANVLKVRDAFEKYIQYIERSIGQVLQNQLVAIEEEIRANEDKYNTLAKLAGDDENLKTRLENQRLKKEEKLEKKRRKAQIRLANFEKSIAISRALINTALGVTNALNTKPAYLAIPLAIAIGALGAIEVAAIAAAPVPQFEKGGIMKHDGVALVGEKRHEIVKEPDGGLWMTGNKPQLSTLKKGSKIYPSVGNYVSQHSGDSVERAAMMTSLQSEARKLTSGETKREFEMNYLAIEKAMSRAVKNADLRPTVINNIDLGHEHYRKDTL